MPLDRQWEPWESEETGKVLLGLLRAGGVLILDLGAGYRRCLVCEKPTGGTFMTCSLLFMLNSGKSLHKMAQLVL